VVGDHMSQTLGQQVVVEANPGADSNLAINRHRR
jgi:tripartite-type tricarboxylate transporter receptor subunit TctC